MNDILQRRATTRESHASLIRIAGGARAVVAALLLCVQTLTVGAQTPTLRADESFEGRRAWVLDNGAIRVTLMESGGDIAEVRLLGNDPQLTLNPMYIPSGAGYMGHLVCFPYFGPASSDERTQGLGGHGEAGSVDWQQTKPPRVDADSITFFYGADLPKTHYRIERAITVRTGEPAVHVEEWVENLAAYDRPYNWNQHATFGAPFVAPEKNVLDTSATRALTDARRTGKGQWSPGREFQWPDASRSDGTTIGLREFHAVPDGQIYTVLLTEPSRDTGWFTLYNTDHRLLVGYVFAAADHPWIVDWQNQPRTDTTAGTARGIEFGTSPFDEGLRRSVDRARMFDTPTFRWIAARQRLATSFTIFLAPIPSGFAGVHDVRPEPTRIVITERGTSRELSVPHTRH